MSRFPLYLLHADGLLRDQVRSLPRCYDVQLVPDWDALSRRLAAAEPGALAVVDPYLSAGGPLAPPLAALLHAFPSTVVVAAIRPEAFRLADVLALGQLGVAEVIRLGVDSTALRVELRIGQARERAALRAVLHRIPAAMPPRTRALLEAALATVVDGGGVPDLARSLFISIRTLQRRSARSGLPPARTLLALLRTVLASRFLDDPGRTVLSAALAAGYASDTSLHRAFRRVGLPSPATLRRTAALDRVVEVCLAHLGGAAS